MRIENEWGVLSGVYFALLFFPGIDLSLSVCLSLLCLALSSPTYHPTSITESRKRKRQQDLKIQKLKAIVSSENILATKS